MVTRPTEVDLPSLQAQLERIERKLDYVVERQEFVEELIDEMTPVARETLVWGTEILGKAEDKGYIAIGEEVLHIADRVVETYGPGEVERLGAHIVELLDTVRNVTQPDVLAVANDATDVLHRADEVAPLGLFGAARASADPDIQRGLGVTLEILRRLGRVRGGEAPAVRRTEAAPTAETPRERPSRTRAPDRPARPTAAGAAPPPSPAEPVTWMGRSFTPEGFLVDPADWDRELGAAIAEALGVEMTDEAWTVVDWARQAYLDGGTSPNVRRIATGSGVGTRQMYTLFPRSPGKTTAMIAGIPKPAGCV